MNSDELNVCNSNPPPPAALPVVDKFHFNFWQRNASLSARCSSSSSSSPALLPKFRPTISSAMPAIADDGEAAGLELDLDKITLGDDDVLSIPPELEEKSYKKGRFLMRFWSWLRSKSKLNHRNVNEMPATTPKGTPSPRRKSLELHARKIFNTKVVSESDRKQEQELLKNWKRSENERLTRSWADVCIANASLCTSIAMSTGSTSSAGHHNGLRRSSYMPITTMKPPSERYRASSLVVPCSQNSSLLHPLSGSRREFSLESGYLSHDCGEGSSSTPNSPKKFTLNQTKNRKSGLSQSISVEDEAGASPTATIMLTTSTAREKRQMFHK